MQIELFDKNIVICYCPIVDLKFSKQPIVGGICPICGSDYKNHEKPKYSWIKTKLSIEEYQHPYREVFTRIKNEN